LLDPQAAPGNPLQIRPDPVQLVKSLKAVDRKEVSGALLVRCLDEYSTLRQAGEAVDPLRFVQIVQFFGVGPTLFDVSE
jgi:hypothetical protein